MDEEKLLAALNNDENINLLELNLDYAQIAQDKNDVLQKLQLKKDVLKDLHNKLKNYRYVSTMDELHFGSYIRWITLKDPSHIHLRNGGIICNIKVHKDDVHINVKNNQRRIFQINMNEVLVFQKLNEQEQIILTALKLLKD
jgi:hypothetical protein